MTGLEGNGDALVLRSADPDATRAIGAAVAAMLVPGDVVALTGDLGAGKTCLVQGAAAALGVRHRVTSPTFVLVKTYDGDIPVVHVDVYRLDRLTEIDALGDEVLASDVVTFVEWGDAIRQILPPDHLEIELVLDESTPVAAGLPTAPGEDAPTGLPAGPRDPDDPDAIVPAPRTLTVRAHGTWVDRLLTLGGGLDPWRAED